MKTTTAKTSLEVLCKCPNCDYYLDISDDESVREQFTRTGELWATDCGIEIKCEECQETFTVTDIES